MLVRIVVHVLKTTCQFYRNSLWDSLMKPWHSLIPSVVPSGIPSGVHSWITLDVNLPELFLNIYSGVPSKVLFEVHSSIPLGVPSCTYPGVSAGIPSKYSRISFSDFSRNFGRDCRDWNIFADFSSIFVQEFFRFFLKNFFQEFLQKYHQELFHRFRLDSFMNWIPSGTPQGFVAELQQGFH